MKNNVYMMFVDVDNEKHGTKQSNKFYNMIPSGDGTTFTAEWGRMGNSKSTKVYPISKWKSTYNSKVRKGYKDISDLKENTTVVQDASGNKVFDEFYNVFAKYTGSMVQKTFLVEGCTQKQIDAAQVLLDKISNLKTIKSINNNLLELYKIIPRRMSDVKYHLIANLEDRNKLVVREQDALDSMDSSNIIHKSNPYKELGLTMFDECDSSQYKMLDDLLSPTNRSRHKIFKAYRVSNAKNQEAFDKALKKAKNKDCELLIHGTRNPNVFSIMKSGLLIRPSNAASFAGSAYGDGVYHSAHTQKSLGYTGYDRDKIFFIQNVNMGKPFVYNGWYRSGKSINRSQMNHRSLNKMGYDSLYVKPGDGLLNSEYIVYKSEQTTLNYLVWMK